MIPEHPFAPVHTRESFLETTSGQDALQRLVDGLGAREPFLLLTGEAGTGKTALAHETIARWGPRVTAAVIAYPALTGVELLEEIVRRFGHEPPDGASRPKLVACLERAHAEIAGRDQVAVVVVDDAHDLSAESLEELRLLVNAAQLAARPLEVLLVGLPALEQRLDDPALAALRQRVSVRVSVPPLSASETQRYLHHRVTAAGGDGPGLFSRRTCRGIAMLTGGVPRRINALATEALRMARAAGHPTVGLECLREAATTLWGSAAASGSLGAEDSGAAEPAGANEAKASAPRPAPVVPPVAMPPAAPVAAPIVAPIVASRAAPIVPTTAAPASAPTAARIDSMHASEPGAPRPTPPATQDPKEWVKRFIGDRGPLQLSSRAFAESGWAAESVEPHALESTATSAPPARAAKRKPGVKLPSSRPRRRGLRGVPVAALLVGLLVIGAVALILHAGGLARMVTRQAAKDPNTPQAPHATSSASSSSRTNARETPAEREPNRSEPASGAAAATNAAAAAPGGEAAPGANDAISEPAGEPKPAHRYTIETGSYLDLQRAIEVRDRLQEVTGIQAWVVVGNEAAGESHRIVLGIFRTADRATTAAEALVASSTLSQAKVVPLPPRRTRR